MTVETLTIDHAEIKEWITAKGGFPARAQEASDQPVEAQLCVGFDRDNTALKEISWDEFFQIFDAHRLGFSFQEEPETGADIRVNKLAKRR